MRLTVPIVAALFIASTQGAPTPRETTERAEDAGNAAHTGLPPLENQHTLYIQGLPQPCTDEELRGLWWEDIRSKITKITIPVHANGRNKDYAHVEFDSDEDMRAALNSNTGNLNGHSLTIRTFTPEEPATDESPPAASPEGARGGFFPIGARGGFGRGAARGVGAGRGGGRRGAKKRALTSASNDGT